MELYCTNCETVTEHDVNVAAAYCGICGNPTDDAPELTQKWARELDN